MPKLRVAVAVVVDEVAPAYVVHLAGEREVVVPAERLRAVELQHVSAAAAAASVDEGVVVDVLVAEFAESVTACLVLNHAARVERIVVGAERTERYSRSVGPHLADAAVVGGVGHDDYEGLLQVFLADGGRTEGVTEQFVVVAFSPTPPVKVVPKRL